ncbi:M1 family metallopeptidase [Phenylobacterium sp. J367]|uniref:M1 family metallopeptidase n=1 Tax=Phenylobacterium sp. J367 TaxID=2898435 RepID=UPI00215169DD|nr:M1 family metallopeptidase [Phenylobacterium sp. J367]MCR5878089.1 M1 family metallopeptidase [Phenylobacterium sp. J367]
MALFTRRTLMTGAAALSLAGPALAQSRADRRKVAPILTTADAVDSRSYARPRDARVTHVDLDLEADFARKVIGGKATLDILARDGVDEVVLDALDLKIASVTDARGRPLQWILGEKDGDKGSPLKIRLGGAKRLVITYEASPGATALQWLAPELTAGKVKPFLYSQGQAILNRSWFPTQDSPGVRQTWSARLVVPADLVAVMSAERLTPKGEPAGPGKRAWRFRMPHPVPTYLVALGVGDLAFQPLGARTGVYTEPAMMAKAAYELADTEKMVEAAERLYGPYRWGRYDVLVLPPAFPYGGMENATLTFLTPTFITGDRANVSLVAHELAHSWSGNLVTNATWPDVWLNEGFTSYVENRIMEAIYGRERAVMEADLAWDGLQSDIRELGGPADPRTRLYGEPGGQIDYFKGETFLRTLETLLGRDCWDGYLRGYFDRHAFQPQTTAGFLADLRREVVKGDAALEAKLKLDEWAYGPGLPANAVHNASARLAEVDRSVKAFTEGRPAASLPAKGWTTQEWQRFLNNLPRQLQAAQLADLDRTFQLNASANGYVRSAWLELAIANRWEPALPSLRAFLTSVGRGLFVNPLYTGLTRQGDWGKALARQYFAEAKGGYHPSLSDGIARRLASAG